MTSMIQKQLHIYVREGTAFFLRGWANHEVWTIYHPHSDEVRQLYLLQTVFFLFLFFFIFYLN